jgi:DNA-3-methyladenine glycosylase I
VSEPTRCPWCWSNPRYLAYHDEEWGVPVRDDRVFFEFLILEGAQAGLSWSTVLNKRDGYRRLYDDFDPEKVARYDDAKLAELLSDPAIIRNRAKVAASISNAQAFLDTQAEFGSFADYIWRFVDNEPIQNRWTTVAEIPSVTPLAETISTDLKRRGFSFVGPTIVYAHMQATGMVNDHVVDCFRYAEIAALSRS